MAKQPAVSGLSTFFTRQNRRDSRDNQRERLDRKIPVSPLAISESSKEFLQNIQEEKEEYLHEMISQKGERIRIFRQIEACSYRIAQSVRSNLDIDESDVRILAQIIFIDSAARNAIISAALVKLLDKSSQTVVINTANVASFKSGRLEFAQEIISSSQGLSKKKLVFFCEVNSDLDSVVIDASTGNLVYEIGEKSLEEFKEETNDQFSDLVALSNKTFARKFRSSRNEAFLLNPQDGFAMPGVVKLINTLIILNGADIERLRLQISRILSVEIEGVSLDDILMDSQYKLEDISQDEALSLRVVKNVVTLAALSKTCREFNDPSVNSVVFNQNHLFCSFVQQIAQAMPQILPPNSFLADQLLDLFSVCLYNLDLQDIWMSQVNYNQDLQFNAQLDLRNFLSLEQKISTSENKEILQFIHNILKNFFDNKLLTGEDQAGFGQEAACEALVFLQNLGAEEEIFRMSYAISSKASQDQPAGDISAQEISRAVAVSEQSLAKRFRA